MTNVAVGILAALIVASGASIHGISSADTAIAAGGACPMPVPTASPSGPTPRPTHRPTPDPADARGINVSVFDGSPSYPALARAGVAFVYARATSSTGYADPTHLRTLVRGRRNGLEVGSYHFFDYRADGAAQARWFVARVQADGGFAGRLPPVLDIECFPPWGAGDRSTTLRGIRAFLTETYRLTGLTPMLYLGRWTWRAWLGDPTLFGDARLWIACWTCGPEPGLPRGWSDWTMWQLGRWFIDGIPRPLGANVFHGTRAELAMLLRHEPALVDDVARDGTSLAIDLSGVDGVAWQVRLDDGAWSAWRPVAPRVDVDLGPAAAPRLVRVRLKDAHGTRSPVWRLAVRSR